MVGPMIIRSWSLNQLCFIGSGRGYNPEKNAVIVIPWPYPTIIVGWFNDYWLYSFSTTIILPLLFVRSHDDCCLSSHSNPIAIPISSLNHQHFPVRSPIHHPIIHHFSQVRFMVDGERIAADDTAEKLGLEVPSFRVPGKMILGRPPF